MSKSSFVSQDDPEPTPLAQPAQTQQHETQVIEMQIEEKFYTEFKPEMLNLSPVRKSRYATLLRNDRNEASIMKIMGQLGFRYTEKALCFVHRNIEYPVDTQAIVHTWLYLFEHESKEDSADFLKGSRSFLSPHALEFLPRQEKAILWDTQDACYLPFQNGVLKITAKDLKLIDYNRLQFVVKQKDIIPHKLDLEIGGDLQKYIQGSDFYKLARNVCTIPRTKQTDDNLFEGLQMAMARTIHTHFNVTDPALVAFTEQVPEGQTNGGGTCKGIIAKAICQVRPAFATLDGKSYRPDDQFFFDRIEPFETKVGFIDETDNFGAMLNRIFSMLTEGFQLKRKFRDTVSIPPEKCPKLILTVNSPKLPTTDSALRRVFIVPLSRYYNLKHQPSDDFGILFGPAWKPKDWNQFFHFMISSLQLYFKLGYNTKRMPRCHAAEALVKKEILEEVGHNLYEFLSNQLKKELEAGKSFRIIPSELLEEYQKFVADQAESTDRFIKTRGFNQRLITFSTLIGWTVEEPKNGEKVKGKLVRVRYFVPPYSNPSETDKKAVQKNTKRSGAKTSAKKVTKVTKETII